MSTKRRVVTVDQLRPSAASPAAQVAQSVHSLSEMRNQMRGLTEEEKSRLAQLIPVKNLVPFPGNADIFGMDEEQIDQTAQAITRMGGQFFGAIWVMPCQEEPGKYTIISGHQRAEAVKKAKGEDAVIPAFVYRDVDPDDVYRMWLDSNLLQRKTNVLARYQLVINVEQHVREAKARKDPRYEKAAMDLVEDITHMTHAQIYRYRSIGQLPPYTKSCCADEDFPYTVVLPVAKFTDLQKQVFDDELRKYMEARASQRLLPETAEIKKIVTEVSKGKGDGFDHTEEEKRYPNSLKALPDEAKQLYMDTQEQLKRKYQDYAASRQHKHEEQTVDQKMTEFTFGIRYLLEDDSFQVLDPKTVTANIAMLEECIKTLKGRKGVY